MDHRAHCKAWETNRGCRDLVWAAALAQHLPANYWRPRPEASYPPPAFLPPDDGTSALPRGLERHPRLPGVLRSTNRPHHSIPTALLAAYATFYGADASSQPEKFVHDVSVHLRNAMQPDPQYSECRHLPPALELCLCQSHERRSEELSRAIGKFNAVLLKDLLQNHGSALEQRVVNPQSKIMDETL